MQISQALCLFALAVLGLLGAEWVQAGIVLDRTRVVFSAGQREVSVAVVNDGDLPYLLQAWIGTDPEHGLPETSSAPFHIVPPLQRINAGARESLRILQLPGMLPSDRESLFWLSVLAIPGHVADGPVDAGRLDMAIQTNIKVFYRPVGMGPLETGREGSLRLSLQRKQGTCLLRVENPSPLHLSIAGMSVIEGAQRAGVWPDGVMLLPRSLTTVEVPDACQGEVAGPAKARMEIINDQGVIQHVDTAVDGPPRGGTP